MVANNFEFLCCHFFIYSFIGWVLETAYKTIRTGKPTNSGFLNGPFVPVYGFGALLVHSIETYSASSVPFALRVLLYTLLATLLEYYTGFAGERIFGVRLWDYRHKPFNLHGRVCLQYSLYWLALVFLYLTVLNPHISRAILKIPPLISVLVNRILIAAILADFAYASGKLHKIVRFFDTLNSDYLSVTREAFFKSIDSFRRLLNSFPNLKTYVRNSIRSNILRDFKMNLMEILGKNIIHESSGAAIMENSEDLESEFYEIVNDLLRHEAFLRLRNYRHHNGSIFDHAKSVAYLTYRFCRTRKIDFRSATRGALLHDFFLYDWRTGKDENGVRHKGHIYLHPAMALENAEKHFPLNDVERDIIINHMWPLSPSMPKYKETFIVSFIDKYISTREFIDALKGASERRPPDEVAQK